MREVNFSYILSNFFWGKKSEILAYVIVKWLLMILYVFRSKPWATCIQTTEDAVLQLPAFLNNTTYLLIDDFFQVYQIWSLDVLKQVSGRTYFLQNLRVFLWEKTWFSTFVLPLLNSQCFVQKQACLILCNYRNIYRHKNN